MKKLTKKWGKMCFLFAVGWEGAGKCSSIAFVMLITVRIPRQKGECHSQSLSKLLVDKSYHPV